MRASVSSFIATTTTQLEEDLVVAVEEDEQ
jgi:hypothetical protein